MIFEAAKLHYLKELALDVIEASRLRPGHHLQDKTGGELPANGMFTEFPSTNSTGVTLIKPGGGSSYPSFWIRDFAMSLSSGLIPLEEIAGMIRITASTQNGPEARMLDAACIPPFAVPDHVNLDGSPVFYPGTYSPGSDQGGEQFGFYPPYCDAFYFIEMVYEYLEQGGDPSILREVVGGYSILDRMEKAYAVPESDPETELTKTELDRRAVNFGFMDIVVQTGFLLFSSILKYRASLQLARILERFEREHGKAEIYKEKARRIQRAVPEVFGDGSGWLKASTGLSGQPDVWGTAFAVYTGLLHGESRQAALRVLHEGYLRGDTCYRGNVRHVPVSGEASPEHVWSHTAEGFARKNRYQNGAYWGTPAGWYIYALNEADPECAKQMFEEYIGELTEGDFRRHGGMGSPWECFHPDGEHRQNGVYMTSVTVPYSVFIKMERGC
jgi:hypothetical protein